MAVGFKRCSADHCFDNGEVQKVALCTQHDVGQHQTENPGNVFVIGPSGSSVALSVCGWNTRKFCIGTVRSWVILIGCSRIVLIGVRNNFPNSFNFRDERVSSDSLNKRVLSHRSEWKISLFLVQYRAISHPFIWLILQLDDPPIGIGRRVGGN